MIDVTKVIVERQIPVRRDGVTKTLYYFSFSGFFVVEGELPVLHGFLNGLAFEILPPARLSDPTFRATPQFTPASFRSQFVFEGETKFPINISAFPSPANESGARLNFWVGSGTSGAETMPTPPPDTLTVILNGPDSSSQSGTVERHLVRPLLEWLRILTNQWWIGRSFESVSGALHFLAPLNERGQIVGSPVPVTRTSTAGIRFRGITSETWSEAGDMMGARKRPPASRVLMSDAEYMLATEEFRSAMISACCSIEAARDECLLKNSVNLASLRCSKTDLLQHLSVGFETVFQKNLEKDAPDLFDYLSAFWIARGDAAHGRPVQWRLAGRVMAIEDVELPGLAEKAHSILDWINDRQVLP